MHEIVVEIVNKLDQLSAHVVASSSEDRAIAEFLGIVGPALTRHDLAAIPGHLARKLREAAPVSLDDDVLSCLMVIPRKLELLQVTASNMFVANSNAAQASVAYLGTLFQVAQALEPLFAWQVLQDTKAMPPALNRRLRGIQADLDALVPNKAQLEEQIRLIQGATEAAESLPTDMQSLREARGVIARLSTDSAELYGKIDQRYQDCERLAKQISEHQADADKLVQQCEEAYRITTTKGLAGAFDQRANRLSNSMWVWVFGLVVALAIGAWLGALRIGILSSAMAEKDPQWGIIWLQIALSALSVGAPLWFAWLATKQIGQRFKLAEDYGYKASVAKAYEGYRKEAARLDETFEARLFASALARLEEAPLRLVGNTEHGSPWHELISSEPFQKALGSIPGLRDKFIELARHRGNSQGSKETLKLVEGEATP